MKPYTFEIIPEQASKDVPAWRLGIMDRDGTVVASRLVYSRPAAIKWAESCITEWDFDMHAARKAIDDAFLAEGPRTKCSPSGRKESDPMKQARDMTQKQFDDACAELRFVTHGILGYYVLPSPKGTVCVSIRNAGKRRRDQLAYLIEQDRIQAGKRGRKESDPMLDKSKDIHCVDCGEHLGNTADSDCISPSADMGSDGKWRCFKHGQAHRGGGAEDA
jgi:hypothetical protein